MKMHRNLPIYKKTADFKETVLTAFICLYVLLLFSFFKKPAIYYFICVIKQSTGVKNALFGNYFFFLLLYLLFPELPMKSHFHQSTSFFCCTSGKGTTKANRIRLIKRLGGRMQSPLRFRYQNGS